MPRWRTLRRAFLRAFIAALATAFMLYAILLSWHVHDYLVASRALTNLESIQLGSSPSVFQSAVRGLKCGIEQHPLQCGMIPGIYRTSLFARFAYRAPRTTAVLINVMDHVGLRGWDLRASAGTASGSIEQVNVGFLVVGKFETLGASWRLVRVLPRYRNEPLSSATASAHPFHVTSIPSGEGYEINVTPAATPSEMQARHIDSRCIISLGGCMNLCAILPNVPQLRHSDGTCASGFRRFR